MAPKRKLTPDSDSKKRKSVKSSSKAKVEAGVDYEPSAINHNELICRELKKYADLQGQMGDIFKRSMLRAIKVISTYPSKLMTGAEAMKLKGVGKSIAAKIDAINENGSLELGVESSADKQVESQARDALTKVYGISAVTANDLFRKHNIRTIGDLRRNQSLLNEKQRLGLKFHAHLSKQLTRAQVHSLKVLIENLLDGVKVTMAGSYRRGEANIGEVHGLLHSDAITGPKQVALADLPSKLALALAEKNYELFAFDGVKPDHIHGIIGLKAATREENHSTSAKTITEYSPKKDKYSKRKPFNFSLTKFNDATRDEPGAIDLFGNGTSTIAFSVTEHEATVPPSGTNPTNDTKGDGFDQDEELNESLYALLDLKVVTPSTLACQLVRATGTNAYYKSLVALAQAKGFALTERQLSREIEGKKSRIETIEERDVYDALGIDYIPPDDKRRKVE